MHDDLKLETRDKVLQKMSRNGAVEQNVSRGTDKNISSRIQEITYERDAAPGSELELGRGAKEAGMAGGGHARHGRQYAQSSETGQEYGQGYGNDTVGDKSYSQGFEDNGGYSQAGGAYYSDHEAYLDSLLQKAGVDTGHQGVTDAHKKAVRRYRVETVPSMSDTSVGVQAQPFFESQSISTAGYLDMTEAGSALKFSASELTDDHAGDSNAEMAEHMDGYFAERDSVLSFSDDAEGKLLHDRAGASQLHDGQKTTRSLAEKEAYKKRISRTSIRQNAVFEKPVGQRFSADGIKTDAAGKTVEKAMSGTTSMAKTAESSLREGAKQKNALKPFSGAADKLMDAASASAHEKVHESEDDNSAVQAAHEAEIQAENVLKAAGSKAADAREGAASKRKARLMFDDEKPTDEFVSGKKPVRHRPSADGGINGNTVVNTGSKYSAGGEETYSKNAAKPDGKKAVSAVVDRKTNVNVGTEAGQGNKGSHLSFQSGRAGNVTDVPKDIAGTGRVDLSSRGDIKKAGKLQFGDMQATDKAKKAGSLNKQIQKKRIKREYAAALKAGKSGLAEGAGAASKAAEAVKKGAGKLKDLLLSILRKNYGVFIALGVAGLLYIMFISSAGTVTSMVSEAGNSLVGSTYLSADDDITTNDEAYVEMERELQNQIDNIESDYSGYDEYRYQVDEISHDPYSLASYFTAIYGNYKAADVSSELLPLFQEQYTLTLNEVVETKTRTVTDPDTGEESEEEYDWYVLEVTLTNAGVDTVAQAHMNDNQKMLYKTYMVTRGNRSYLFGDDIVPGNVADGGLFYDIPPEALEDEAFARMIAEAEKYLGMEYVWGGSSPSSGFDCSGFVSWVINHSGNGWNVGRSTANGLMGHCTRISSSEAKPGDLIFFEKTYNTSGASHVGIYVGDGMMLHCGNPIQYTSINSNYWKQHFLSFGRISD